MKDLYLIECSGPSRPDWILHSVQDNLDDVELALEHLKTRKLDHPDEWYEDIQVVHKYSSRVLKTVNVTPIY